MRPSSWLVENGSNTLPSRDTVGRANRELGYSMMPARKIRTVPPPPVTLRGGALRAVLREAVRLARAPMTSSRTGSAVSQNTSYGWAVS